MSRILLLSVLLSSCICEAVFSQINSFPYTIDFESGASGWTAENGGDPAGWELGTPSGFGISTAHSGNNAWVTNLNGYYSSNADIVLMSPEFDFTGFTVAPVISFYVNYDLENGYDFGILEYSIQGGPWNALGSNVSTGIGWYTATEGWSGNSGGWNLAAHALEGLQGNSSVRLRFHLTSDGSTHEDGMGIDDIVVQAFSNDIALSDAIGFNDAGLGNSEEVTFTVKAGLQTVTSFEVTVVVTGPLNYTINRTFSGLNIIHAATQQLQISGLDFSLSGEYLVTITSTTPDLVPENNTTQAIVRNFRYVDSLPYRQDFESGTGDWFAHNDGADGWAWGHPGSIGFQAAHSGSNAWVTNLNGNYSNNADYYLFSPAFNFESITTDPFLAFYLNYDTEFCCDTAVVEYSFDKGSTWHFLGDQSSGGVNWYGPNGWSDYSDGWVQVVHELSGMAGQPSVILRLRMTTNEATTSEGLGVDDIFIGYIEPDAGEDQVVCATRASIAAAIPPFGTGTWSIESGSGGSLESASVAAMTFEGVIGETYILRWTVTPGGIYPAVHDELTLTLSDVPPPTTASAGEDTVVCGTTASINTVLNANIPSQGTGEWVILSGDGGNLISPSNAFSEFTGQAGSEYELRWAIVNSVGCVSLDDIIIRMSPVPDKPVIVAEGEFSGDVAVLSVDTADSYAWYWNGQLIDADSPVIEISEDGTYIVQTTKNNCTSEISDTYLAIVTSAQFNIDEDVSFFPNPVVDKLVIRLSRNHVVIRIRDARGQLIEGFAVVHQGLQHEVDLSHLGKGFYTVEVISEGIRSVKKIIRH